MSNECTNFCNHFFTLGDQRLCIGNAKSPQFTQLELEHNEGLRRPVMEFTRDTMAFISPPRLLVVR